MKRLFAIRDNSTGRTQDEFFEDKRKAKTKRDELNTEAQTSFRYTITPGPDHHKF